MKTGNRPIFSHCLSIFWPRLDNFRMLCKQKVMYVHKLFIKKKVANFPSYFLLISQDVSKNYVDDDNDCDNDDDDDDDEKAFKTLAPHPNE